MLPKQDKSEFLVYETNKYLPYNSEDAVTNQTSIKELKKYDNEFYKIVITKNPNANGYIPVVSEASTDLLLLILDSDGKILDVLLIENKVTINSK